VNCTLCRDEIVITSDPTAAPGSSRYQIYFTLKSNFSNVAQDCPDPDSTAPAQDAFKISVAPSDPNITGVCLESYDVGLGVCLAQNVVSIPVDQGAYIDGKPRPTDACFKERPPVDVMLVLDKSGSMSTPATGQTATLVTTPAPTRMDALHFATNDFVNLWTALPTPTPATPTPTPDMVAGIGFDTTPTAQIAATDVRLSSGTVTSWVSGLQPGGWTSIGAALKLADANSLLTPVSGRRKVVLLMTDGQQNTNPFVKGDLGLYCDNAPGSVCTLPANCTLGTPCPLVNHPQFYTVTLGPTIGPTGAILNEVADATLGFYLHTDDNAGLLGPFFLELLQNFLKFNTYETVRLTSGIAPYSAPGTTPYSATIPISTTSRDVEFSLMWPKSLGVLRLTVIPPGGSPPGVPPIVQENASGFISIVQTLPLPAPFDPMGDWKINVEAVNPNAPAAVMTTQSGIPFDLHVMADDGAIKSDLSIVPGDYKPGDNIRLRAKLTHFGRPILGLSSGQIIAELVKPGASIGDILSDSKASADPTGPDPQTPAEAKLANTLKDNPSVLVHAPLEILQLYDDGKAEHGDDVAGDGIYNALYPVTLPGDYNFLFAVESTAADAVRFSRQQLRTAYVRAVLDKDNKTMFQSTIQPCTSGTASLRGTVSDRQGALLAGVIVIAINTITGKKMTTATAANGSYYFADLTPGQYQVDVPGFAALFPNIQLSAGQNAIYNVYWPAGAIAAQIINAGRAKACNNLIVTMKPRTKFGNRLGPGWANYLWLTTPNGAAFKPKDNLDGTYTATLNYVGNKPPDAVLHFENVIAIIGDSVTPDQLPQKLDASNEVAKVPPPGRWAIFLDAGTNVPHGTFGNAFNKGVSFNAGLEYILNAHVSAEGIFGYHHFGGKTTGDLNVFQFTAGGKIYSSPFGGNNRAFVRAGLGGYHFTVGSTTNFGSYVGGGWLHELGPHLGLEVAYTAHGTKTPVQATWFSSVQGGVRWVF